MKYNIIIAKFTAILFGYDMDAIGIVAGLIALAFVVTAMVKQIREVKGYH